MDIISTLSTAISYAQRLREISKNVENSEFKNLLADLLGQLADLKMEAVSYKERISHLEEENALLKKTAIPQEEKPIGKKWNCYVFEGDESLYCPGCWDAKRKKHSTSKSLMNYRMCTVCQTPIGAG